MLPIRFTPDRSFEPVEGVTVTQTAIDNGTRYTASMEAGGKPVAFLHIEVTPGMSAFIYPRQETISVRRFTGLIPSLNVRPSGMQMKVQMRLLNFIIRQALDVQRGADTPSPRLNNG